MISRSEGLAHELAKWRVWALTADKSENGWQSDAPNWGKVIASAQEELLQDRPTHEAVSNLCVVFSLSEEGEDLADFLKAHLRMVPKETISALASSTDPAVRWQIYDCMDPDDSFCRGVLRAGTQDREQYPRRRAFLRLLSAATVSMDVAGEAINNEDPIIRREGRRVLQASEALPPESR